MTEKELAEKFDNFAWNVYALRRNAHMTQQELAKIMGTSSSVISHLESKKRMDVLGSTALLVADAFGVTVDEMYNTRVQLEYPLDRLMGRRPWRER